jgi:DNA-directed RNA polymerase subunit beta'
MRDITDFDSIEIHIASPEWIKAMSYGEVKKPETINYRTLRPEKDGLFCERIFGTTKEWECYCGKFKSMRYKGVICDRCGVEVTSFKVRRERMGHIELASPVSHIWYYRSVPSRIGLILDIPVTALRSILYFEKYIVIDPGDTDLKTKQILSEEEYFELRERYGLAFQATTGAEAVKILLENIDLKKEADNLRRMMLEKHKKCDKRLLKRIELLEDFSNSKNKPEWMMLDVVPVIPPDLRPMVQLDGGRFATSDLNDLYRRVINRNNRLKRLLELNAPDIIVRNEKRMLQEAVDALFDNSKKRKVVKGSSARPLKSLSDLLKGKQGRFRQNLLGKRVDYSGRSVIVVGPTLKMHQCGLPVKMALELFKPFVMNKLVDREIVFNIKKAKQLIELENPEVFHILEEVIAEHPVLLNRAPTLHRLGIQAFEPVLVEGKAIQLHPLVCKAFNADFDGDQMAVHVPLSIEAQAECWMLMLSAKNLLDPANGNPIVGPSQDMILGINYLTRIQEGVKGEGKCFKDENEVIFAVEAQTVHLQAKIKVKMNGVYVETSPGRIILNDALPEGIPYINEPLNDKRVSKIIAETYKKKGAALTVRMLDAIKDTGFRYATVFGATIGMEDIIVPENKKDILEKAQGKADVLYEEYRNGIISSEERFNKIQDIWTRASQEVAHSLMETLKKDKKGFNPVYMMADSGARGSATQIRQLAGMRGLMTKPGGDIIELPIKSNFKEGLSVIEFYISTNGARKGLADTALKTADAGYLTRRLVDIAQDVIINEHDCGTINGIVMTAIKEGDEVLETLKDRIVGRFAAEDVRDPISGKIVIKSNDLITEEIADEIESLYIESVKLRTVYTCESKRGVCVKCYGQNLATNKTVDIGEAIGIIAAQSIGQPGTQLTMRTFHIGGAATGSAQENALRYNYKTLVEDLKGSTISMKDGDTLFARKGYLYVSRLNAIYDIEKGTEFKVKEGEKVVNGKLLYIDKSGKDVLSNHVGFVKIYNDKLFITAQTQEVEVSPGSILFKKIGDAVEPKDTILQFDPFVQPIITEKGGKIKFEDLKIGITIKEEIDETTSTKKHRVSDSFLDTLQPRIVIHDENDKVIASYLLPGGAYLNVKDGEVVHAGDTIAKIIKKTSKVADITGGLPRVAELFEARKPKDAAVLAKVSGTIRFKGKLKGKDIIVIEDVFGNEFKHTVPSGAYLLVRDGDMVKSGDQISEGPVNPHDVLADLGESKLQQFLMDEVQGVYRLQGVNINDKHIGVIIRQMMKKVEITDVGDTHFIVGQFIDKWRFTDTNKKVIREGGQPAIAKPILLGITRASLSIDSWLSAASFQETTKVLTNASIKGLCDDLIGLKENVVIGHLIPAGTGMKYYKNIKLYDENMEDLDISVSKIMEEKNKPIGENAIIDRDREVIDRIG